MKLSSRARYGLKLMLQLAKAADPDANLSIGQIASKTLLSRRYLEQLAVGLKNASLITATTGREGGYRLAKPSGDITIREIVEASIGPISIVGCVGEPDACMWSETCECRPLYSLINNGITAVLDGFSLADMVRTDLAERVAIETDKKRASPAGGGADPTDQGATGCPG